MRDPLLVRWEPRADARVRLICFPYAGVGASVYRPWLAMLPPSVDLVSIQLPGRETRLREPPLREISTAADAVLASLESLDGKPFAFFGHSMGAVLAWAVAQDLARRGQRLPVQLTLSGRRAPGVADRDPPLRHLSDEAFIGEINRRYGGIPPQVAADKEIMALLLPGLRADIAALETHEPDSAGPLPVPLLVLGGADDERARAADIEAWRRQTAATFRARIFPGGHFYLNEHRRAVVDELLGELAPWADTARRMQEASA